MVPSLNSTVLLKQIGEIPFGLKLTRVEQLKYSKEIFLIEGSDGSLSNSLALQLAQQQFVLLNLEIVRHDEKPHAYAHTHLPFKRVLQSPWKSPRNPFCTDSILDPFCHNVERCGLKIETAISTNVHDSHFNTATCVVYIFQSRISCCFRKKH